MSSHRPITFMRVVLAALLASCAQAHAQSPSATPPTPASEPALAGKNTISGVTVAEGKLGEWTAQFDYFFTGQPVTAAFQIDLVPRGSYDMTMVPAPQRGAHHVSVPIAYPGAEMSTRQVIVSLLQAGGSSTVLASQQVNAAIHWPTPDTWTLNASLVNASPEQSLDLVVSLIDSGDEERLSQARQMLERLIAQNPRLDGAYVELARVAMKTNWGPEGLHQAETLINSALQIRPESVDAKILLGYVYTHQQHFAKAEALFAESARANPPNLWLWANWGELLTMQGKPDLAIAKFREAIKRPMTHDKHDRARANAYEQLFAILGARKDYDAMEPLYKQRVEEFGPGACYSADYARFMLTVRGDVQAAIDLSRRALNQDCEDTRSREMLGLASYVKWANGSGPENAAALNEAHVFLAPGPTALYKLALSDRTVGAAKRLIASGEDIDQKDNEHLTALALALENKDLGAAKRLLSLGAHADTPVGYGDIPVALMPVMESDLEAIRLLQSAGVDYSKLRYHGATAFDFAKQTGNNELLEVLKRKEVAL